MIKKVTVKTLKQKVNKSIQQSVFFSELLKENFEGSCFCVCKDHSIIKKRIVIITQ